MLLWRSPVKFVISRSTNGEPGLPVSEPVISVICHLSMRPPASVSRRGACREKQTDAIHAIGTQINCGVERNAHEKKCKDESEGMNTQCNLK